MLWLFVAATVAIEVLFSVLIYRRQRKLVRNFLFELDLAEDTIDFYAREHEKVWSDGYEFCLRHGRDDNHRMIPAEDVERELTSLVHEFELIIDEVAVGALDRFSAEQELTAAHGWAERSLDLEEMLAL